MIQNQSVQNQYGVALAICNFLLPETEQDCTGMAEQDPNPVAGSQVMVLFNNMQAGMYNVILYNNAGQKIIQKKIEHQAGTASYSISLPTGIAKGAYYISIQSNTMKEVEKLLIE